MLCAAIDIGSNTTRVLVAEPDGGQLRKVMEQRAYNRIGKAATHDGAIDEEKLAEVAEVVATQVRLAEELGAEAIRIVATAAIREAANRDQAVGLIAREAGVAVEVLSEHDEGRLAFIGATKTLGHPVTGDIGVVDVGYVGHSSGRCPPPPLAAKPKLGYCPVAKPRAIEGLEAAQPYARAAAR